MANDANLEALISRRAYDYGPYNLFVRNKMETDMPELFRAIVSGEMAKVHGHGAFEVACIVYEEFTRRNYDRMVTRQHEEGGGEVSPEYWTDPEVLEAISSDRFAEIFANDPVEAAYATYALLTTDFDNNDDHRDHALLASSDPNQGK